MQNVGQSVFVIGFLGKVATCFGPVVRFQLRDVSGSTSMQKSKIFFISVLQCKPASEFRSRCTLCVQWISPRLRKGSTFPATLNYLPFAFKVKSKTIRSKSKCLESMFICFSQFFFKIFGACHYDVTAGKHWGCWYFIWYQCLEESLSTKINIIVLLQNLLDKMLEKLDVMYELENQSGHILLS